MSFALKKQIKKELLSSDWCGKVEEAAVAALATLIDERHGGQLDVLPDILKACTTGRGSFEVYMCPTYTLDSLAEGGT